MWDLRSPGATAEMRTEPHREFRVSEPGYWRDRAGHLPYTRGCVVAVIVVVVISWYSARPLGYQEPQRPWHCDRRRRRRPPWGAVAVGPRYQESRDQRATAGRRTPFRYGPGRPPTPHYPYRLPAGRSSTHGRFPKRETTKLPSHDRLARAR